jgi:glycosyltransferase involved in cell wall biosynthesis
MQNFPTEFELVYIAASEYPSTAANSVQVIKQSNAFASMGVKVLLLARERSRDYKDIESIRDEYGLSGRVAMKLMRGWSIFPEILVSLWYPIWLALHASGVVSVIYGRHALGLFACGLFIPRNIPIIFESHGPPKWFESLALRALCFLGRLTRIVAISQSLKEILLRQHSYLRRVDIIVAHDGCDPQDKLPASDSVLRAGYVGSFYRGRGLELIHEVAILCPDVDFHLVGGDASMYESLVGSPPLGNIRCHGRVAPAKLGDYYKFFNVALAPYARKTEIADGTNTVDYMSPLKIFEYMSYGKAVIASNLPVLKEILINDENALFAEPDCPNHWADILNRLRDKSLRERLSSKAQLDSVTHYTWRARAQFVLNL